MEPQFQVVLYDPVDLSADDLLVDFFLVKNVSTQYAQDQRMTTLDLLIRFLSDSQHAL